MSDCICIFCVLVTSIQLTESLQLSIRLIHFCISECTLSALKMSILIFYHRDFFTDVRYLFGMIFDISISPSSWWNSSSAVTFSASVHGLFLTRLRLDNTHCIVHRDVIEDLSKCCYNTVGLVCMCVVTDHHLSSKCVTVIKKHEVILHCETGIGFHLLFNRPFKSIIRYQTWGAIKSHH